MTVEQRRWLRLTITNLLVLALGFGLGLVFDDYAEWYRGQANRPSTVPVTGLITYNGIPVSQAVVTFCPTVAGGFAASGVTDGAGNFTLTTFTPKDGCCSGLYTVTVSKSSQTSRQGGGLVVRQHLPAKYNNRKTSALIADIGLAGGNFSFDLVN